MAITYKSKITYKDSQVLDEEPKQPSTFQQIMTNLSRPSAAIRARIREGQDSGDVSKIKEAGEAGFKDPGSVETFQNERLRKTNEALPEDSSTLTRYIVGTPNSILGLGQDIATDPVGMAVGAIGGLGMRALGKVPFRGVTIGARASNIPLSMNPIKSFKRLTASRPEQIGIQQENIARGVKSTMKLLPPDEKELAKAVRSTSRLPDNRQRIIAQSEKLPSVSESMKVIKKTGSADELTSQLTSELDRALEARKAIYAKGNLTKDRGQHDEAFKYLKEVRKGPYKDTQMKAVEGALDRDIKVLNEAEGSMQPDEYVNFLQKQKEFYAKNAKEIFDAVKAGADPTLNVEKEMYAKLAQGYKNKLEKIDKMVGPLNRKIQGLMKGSESSSTIASKGRIKTEQSFGDEVIEGMRGGLKSTAAATLRATTRQLRKGVDVKKLTGRIEKFRREAKEAGNLAELLKKLQIPAKERPMFLKQPDIAELEYGTKALQAPQPTKPKQLQFTGSEGTIDIPEYLQDDLAKIAQKFNVSDVPRNVRETVASIPKMSTTSKSQEKIINRLIRNFQERNR